MITDQFKTKSTYNSNIVLTNEDKKSKVKIYCTEPYAQELYTIMSSHPSYNNISPKELTQGHVYRVNAKRISYKDETIYAEESASNSHVIIPFREYSGDIEELATGLNSEFYVQLYKSTKYGEHYGSEKKAHSVAYKQELFENLSANQWFDVTITKLIKGGYLALYKDEIECFIPGSHAAANIVHNFNDMLNRTLTVMVDNYDHSNNLFILSYKKYVAESMPTMIGNLEFNREYTGVLTNKPYDFGVFVEIDGYYTGLVHSSEFKDYENVRKTLKTGDILPVFVKDITTKGSQFRIVLTLSQENTNVDKLAWQKLKERTESKTFTYEVNLKKNSISIDIDGEHYEVSMRRKDLEKNLNEFPYVKVSKVDILNKSLKFEFVSEQS